MMLRVNLEGLNVQKFILELVYMRLFMSLWVYVFYFASSLIFYHRFKVWGLIFIWSFDHASYHIFDKRFLGT